MTIQLIFAIASLILLFLLSKKVKFLKKENMRLTNIIIARDLEIEFIFSISKVSESKQALIDFIKSTTSAGEVNIANPSLENTKISKIDQLQNELSKVVAEENFELAAQLRDQITSLKNPAKNPQQNKKDGNQ